MISHALHLSIFEQPSPIGFFNTLLEQMFLEPGKALRGCKLAMLRLGYAMIGARQQKQFFWLLQNLVHELRMLPGHKFILCALNDLYELQGCNFRGQIPPAGIRKKIRFQLLQIDRRYIVLQRQQLFGRCPNR